MPSSACTLQQSNAVQEAHRPATQPPPPPLTPSPSTRANAMPLAPLSLDPAPSPVLRPAAGSCGGRILPGLAPRLCRPLRAAPVVPATAEEPTSAAARGRLESLSQVAGVLGTQWGDEGKGKLVDILAQRFDVVARCQVFHSLSRAPGSRNARCFLTARRSGWCSRKLLVDMS